MISKIYTVTATNINVSTFSNKHQHATYPCELYQCACSDNNSRQTRNITVSTASARSRNIILNHLLHYDLPLLLQVPQPIPHQVRVN